jgi:hypothetical protein
MAKITGATARLVSRAFKTAFENQLAKLDADKRAEAVKQFGNVVEYVSLFLNAHNDTIKIDAFKEFMKLDK